MKKQEVIQKVQDSLGSLFTKEDVINCLNMVAEEQPKVESKPTYPSKEWLDKIKEKVLDAVRRVDSSDSDLIEVDNMEFEIRYGNQIELDSCDVNASAMINLIENDIEDAFGEIEDDIIEEESDERLSSPEAVEKALNEY